MNRFKKELTKKGFRMQHLEPTLPSNDGLDSVEVNSEEASITHHYTFLSMKTYLDRKMEVKEVHYF